MVWDGTTKIEEDDTVMSDVISMDDEAEITFGMAKTLFCQHLCNLRISFPNETIYIALADIKACFRYPRIHPDLTGAFGFLADGFYNLAVAMVFGSNTSAPGWEPLRRAIEGLSVKFANDPSLVEKHKKYLDMIRWDVPKVTTERPVKACSCALNPGVLDSRGKQIPKSANI